MAEVLRSICSHVDYVIQLVGALNSISEHVLCYDSLIACSNVLCGGARVAIHYGLAVAA